MRPDEHKRKRSAQYKKTHGVKGGPHSDKKNADDSSLKQKGSKQRPEQKKGAQASSKSSQPASSSSQNSKEALSSSGSSEDEQQQNRQTFSRRQVVSNWSRYDQIDDEEEEDDIPLQRGDDFSKLLSKAGGASSQFRFKDEEDWEDDVSVTAQSDVLSIDMNSLVNSLQCIPLYQRLGIDKDLFSVEQLSKMDDEAVCQRRLYSPGVTEVQTTETSVYKSNRNTKSENRNISQGTLPSNVTNNEKIVSKPCTVQTDNGAISHVSQDSTAVDSGTINITEETDDLDLLLSLDTPSSVSDKVGQDVRTKLPKTEDKSDVKITNVNPKSTQGDTKVNVPGKKTNNQELEDWLDSILDD